MYVLHHSVIVKRMIVPLFQGDGQVDVVQCVYEWYTLE